MGWAAVHKGCRHLPYSTCVLVRGHNEHACMPRDISSKSQTMMKVLQCYAAPEKIAARTAWHQYHLNWKRNALLANALYQHSSVVTLADNAPPCLATMQHIKNATDGNNCEVRCFQSLWLQSKARTIHFAREGSIQQQASQCTEGQNATSMHWLHLKPNMQQRTGCTWNQHAIAANACWKKKLRAEHSLPSGPSSQMQAAH